MKRLLLGALCVAGLVQMASAATIPAKAIVAQLLLDRAFDQSLATHRATKPWPWADMAAVARLTVPRLGTTRIILGAGSGQAMAFGPTLLAGGAAIGAPGTTVLAAHRDTHFAFLKDIRPGDRFGVQGIDGTTRHYRVTGTEVVRFDAFTVAADRSGHQLALITCYPFGAMTQGPLRFVVRADQVAA